MYGLILGIVLVGAAGSEVVPPVAADAPWWWERLLDIVGLLAWPLAVIVIVIVVLVLFYGRLKVLLDRIVSAKLPGVAEVSFGNASVDKPKDEALPASSEVPSISDVQWTKHANVFWLGHDLMWTMDVVLRGAPRNSILHGLRQSLHHLHEIRLTGEPGQVLEQLYERAAALGEADWTANVRNQYATDLNRLILSVGGIANASQEGFRNKPEGN